MVLGGLILLTYQYFSRPHHFRFKLKHAWLFFQMIFLGIIINYTLRFWALNYITSSKACFLYNFQPFLASFYSYMLYGSLMTRSQWAGLIIGFLGMIPILISSSPTEAALGEFLFFSWPELAILVSVATHSYSWFILRRLVKSKNYTPMMANGISMFTGGFLSLMASLFIDGLPIIDHVVTFSGWLLAVTLISNVICYTIYGHLLQKYSPTFLAFAGFITPIFAAIYGWAFLGEVVTWHFYVSSIIVLSGLYIFYKDELSALGRESMYEEQ